MNKKKFFNILFIFIFFAVCLLPVCKIDKAALRSHRENREVASFYPLFYGNGTLNNTFGKDFDNWFSDRFFLRDNLIEMYVKLKYFFSFDTFIFEHSIFNKKNHFYFYTKSDNTSPYLLFGDNIDYVAGILSKINKDFEKNNTKFYIILIPPKQVIYREKLKDYEAYFDKYVSVENETVEKLRKLSGCKIIHPYNEFMNAKKDDYIFFRQDNHLTDYGSYIAYLALSKEIKKDFSNYKVMSLKDYSVSKNIYIRSDFKRNFDFGSIYYSIPFSDKMFYKFLDTEYIYYDYKYPNKTKGIIDNIKLIKEFYTPANPDIKLLMMGDCYNEGILQFIPYGVKELLYLRFTSQLFLKEADEFKMYSRFWNKITEFNPDIAVLCVTYEHITKFKDLLD